MNNATTLATHLTVSLTYHYKTVSQSAFHVLGDRAHLSHDMSTLSNDKSLSSVSLIDHGTVRTQMTLLTLFNIVVNVARCLLKATIAY